MAKSKQQSSSPAQGRGGSFISDAASRQNFMTDVQAAKPQGARFDLSKSWKGTFDMGYLVPCLVMEGLPKDVIKFRSEVFARFQSLISPAMHRFDVTTELFFTPYRILWDGWKESLMSVHNGDLTPPAFPYLQDLVVTNFSEADYMGFPLKTIDKVNPFAFAASNLIWNEYYRNPAIDAEIPYKLVDGLNPSSNFNILKKKNWNSDYFTRALPAAQAGAPVTFPIAPSAPVVLNTDGSVVGRWTNINGIPYANINAVGSDSGGTSSVINPPSGFNPTLYDPNGSLVADLSDATSITVSDWRLAIKLQEWAERAMRFVGGAKGRYKDFMKGFFNSNIKDETLQRPLYLGGTTQPMVINGVTQTSETASTPLGELAGQGVSIGANGYKPAYTDEHGVFIAYICCRPKTGYMDGLPRMFSKFDPIDYGHPDFAHLSEQPVLNKEVYYDAVDGLNNLPFGYQPIYSDYRYNNSSTHGAFRTSQDYWTENRKFALRPSLNKSFVECTPAQRIFALSPMPTGTQIQCEIWWDIDGYRQLPFFGTPMN